MNTVALLTLDRGSILYNPDQMPSEIVLKHIDGELIKIERDGQGSWLSKRREELEINFCRDNRQLPFAVYTKDEVYYRVYLTEEGEGGSASVFEVAVLEKREGPRGEWREIGRTGSTEVGHLIETVAEETDMEAVWGDAGDLQETIDDQQELFQASRTAGDENVRERAAIQNKTVFDPSIPQPRPVTFPTRRE